MQIQESKSGAVLIVSIQGRLDASTSPSAQEKLGSMLDRGDTLIVMDLSQVDHIGSAGLRIFMTAAKRLKSSNGKIVFCALGEHISQLFDIAGFTGLFQIYATRDKAVSALATKPQA